VIQGVTVEHGIPIPPRRVKWPEGSCHSCWRMPRPGYATCDFHLTQNRQNHEKRKSQGLCTWGGCPSAPKDDHTLCDLHLKEMLDRAVERREDRKARKVCIQCGKLPSWWGLLCLICRQNYTKNILPLGARKALAKHRRQEIINTRRIVACAALEVATAYRRDLMDQRFPRLLIMRHGLNDGVDRTLEEIGARFEISRERVRQIELRGLARIRRKGIDVSLLTPPFHEVQRTHFKNRKHLVSDEKRKHAAAHGLVAKALLDGSLVKKPCGWQVSPDVKCGDSETVGHHPDYDKPLEVIWLCRGHHMRAHGRCKA